MKKFLAVAAMCSTMMAPMFVSPAFADSILEPFPNAEGPSGALTALMETQCDIVASTYVSGNDRYSAVAMPGLPTLVAGPTELPGTRSNQSNVQPAGTHVLGQITYPGAVYRVGGSVNLFAMQIMTGDYWTDSTYEYDAEFTSRFSYAYDCVISKETYHAGVTGPVEGFYTNNGTNPSGNEGSCQGLSPENPHWGTNLGNCIFTKTGDGETSDPTYDEPVAVATVPQVALEENQTDNLHGFEDHGGPTNPAPAHSNGQVVVCNSPTTSTKGNPGTWKAQNGYSGANCNTSYFNSAAWGAGTDTSQGTYISVPMN